MKMYDICRLCENKDSLELNNTDSKTFFDLNNDIGYTYIL